MGRDWRESYTEPHFGCNIGAAIVSLASNGVKGILLLRVDCRRRSTMGVCHSHGHHYTTNPVVFCKRSKYLLWARLASNCHSNPEVVVYTHDEVPSQIKRWTKANGKELEGLIKRREAGALLFEGKSWQ